MGKKTPTGFFAYPSKPPTISEAITSAVKRINSGSVAHIQTWEDLSVSGKVIVAEILKAIDESSFFCVDLTGLNPNALFEFGYAFGRDKPIWILLDNSFKQNKDHFEQFKILTTIGYSAYQNSMQIEADFYRERPYESEGETLFGKIIEPNLQSDEPEKLLYLKSRFDTEASIRLSKRITDSPIPQTVDDPQEVPFQPLSWYGTNIYSSTCVICHLMHPDIDGALLHNAKYALAAGMALGLGKPVMMLTHGDYLAPLDYRDLLIQYKTASEAVNRLDGWLKPKEDEWIAKESKRQTHVLTLKLATELKGLQLGEPIAENEADKLVDFYFIETVAYTEALAGKQTVFYGRKGTGKTANFLKLVNQIGSDRRNLVVPIKPVAYDLQGITELLSRYHERDKKTFAVESLWKFLLLSEVAISVAKIISGRPQPDKDEIALIELLERDDGMLKKDFSIRLEKCIFRLNQAQQQTQEGERSIERDQISITLALHEGILSEMRKLLGRILSNKKRVAILIDNLDKAWDKNSDLTNLAEFFLGLLTAAKKLSQEFSRSDSKRDAVYVTSAIFMRSDIFNRVRSVAREPDKINSYRLFWDDSELLFRVIEERFTALHRGNVEDIWERYFCETVSGQPTKQYFFVHSLPRPRDLVYFVKAAVAIAVNRRHGRVEESDVLEAGKQYSEFAIRSLLVESDLTICSLEDVIYEFAGSGPRLTYTEVKDFITAAKVPTEDIQEVIDALCTLRFLGVEVPGGEFRFADDLQEYKKIQILSRKLSQSREEPSEFMINPAYLAFLE